MEDGQDTAAQYSNRRGALRGLTILQTGGTASSVAPTETIPQQQGLVCECRTRKTGFRAAMSEETQHLVLKGEKGVPVKAWVKGVPLEEQAKQQLLNVAQLPFVFKWVAAMPDVHWGIGATVGSVIPTKGAIIPAAVGVDIGCGMMAVQTDLNARDLPDNLHAMRTAIEQAVPHGRTQSWRQGRRGRVARHSGAQPGSVGRQPEGSLRRDFAEAPEARSRQPLQSSGNAGHGKSLHRGVPGRSGQRVVHAAQRLARRRQPHGQLLH